MKFADHFSKFAGDYSRYRPHHPPELFDYLAGIAPSNELAWDCGTGSGQAALQLARHFQKVVATDASHEQLANAFPHARVEYRVEPAEKVSLPSHSADLVTAAVAVHWFDLDPFYREVRRVLKAGGVLAVWTYHLPTITEKIVAVMRVYSQEILAGYWPQRFQYADAKYETLPFPFVKISPPEFNMKAEWDLNQLGGFMSSWSAAGKYLDEKGSHPLEKIWDDLQEAWGAPDRKREVIWPLYLKVGKVD